VGLRPNWLAEHHNVSGIASAATAVLIAYIADGTRTIRAGSGGIMLLNHAPLIVAEQFGTIETLYPRRIDLGLGRAPETDMLTSRALRRALETNAPTLADDVSELRQYSEDVEGGRLSAQFHAPACRSHCLFWVRAYSGHRCRQC